MQPLTLPSVGASTILRFSLAHNSHLGRQKYPSRQTRYLNSSLCGEKYRLDRALTPAGEKTTRTIPFRRALFAVSLLLCLTGPLSPVGSGISWASTIDDFSQGALSLQATDYLPGQTAVQEGLSASAVIGGVRSVYAGSVDLATLSIDPAVGRFLFSADSSWGYFTLQYGDTIPLAANLSGDGSNQFLINIDELTPGLWRGDFSFEIKSNDEWSSCGFDDDLFALNGPGQLTIPFSRFQGADLTHIQAIRIHVGRFEPTFRIGIDSIMTIPEPGTLTMLLGLGICLALFAYKKSRRRER
jgi:hypothetical protein